MLRNGWQICRLSTILPRLSGVVLLNISLDPYVSPTTPLAEPPGNVADLRFEDIEPSPREDFILVLKHPRANISADRLIGWSGPGEDARLADVRFRRRAIEIAAESEVPEMLSEFNG